MRNETRKKQRGSREKQRGAEIEQREAEIEQREAEIEQREAEREARKLGDPPILDWVRGSNPRSPRHPSPTRAG